MYKNQALFDSSSELILNLFSFAPVFCFKFKKETR